MPIMKNALVHIKMENDKGYLVDTTVNIHNDDVVFKFQGKQFKGYIDPAGLYIEWDRPEPDLSAQDMIDAVICLPIRKLSLTKKK